MRIETFESAAQAAGAAADALAAQLSGAGPKALMITGGRGVGEAYDRLSLAELDWARITVTLSDERFVDPASTDSNERLARDRLLKNRAAQAPFVPLKGSGSTPDDDARAVEPCIRLLVPFDAAILGMGDDGHIGSIYPGAPDLAAALDPAGERCVVGVEKAGLPPYVPRISLAGPALLCARLTVLLMAGAGKRALIERVFADESFTPPVAALIRRRTPPVRILWSV
jgi:6-phosphogluconolactonase